MRRVRNQEVSSALNVSLIILDTKYVIAESLDLVAKVIIPCKSDVWLTVHRNSVWIRNQLDVTFVLSFIFSFTSRSTCFGQPCAHLQELHSVIATCWYCAVAAGRLSEPVSR